MFTNFRTRINRFLAPTSLDPTQRRNYINVEMDAIGIGLSSAASNFLPVFLSRLQATSFQVGMLSSMPAVTGLILALPLGRFLQNQPKIVPWFSFARLAVITSYALTGIAPFFISSQSLIYAILAIWALATLPQTMVAICFSVVMNAVAGPTGRFELMSRRWSILGITTALVVFLIGQFLSGNEGLFPLNYQYAFIGLSVGGLISFYFSSHIKLPPVEVKPKGKRKSILENASEYLQLIRKERAFTSFILKRFVFFSGISFAVPLFPLYYVREIKASDSWIAAIATTQTFILVLGYFFWTHQSRKRGSRRVLLWSTLGFSFYPVLITLTHQTWLIAVFAGFSGIFQAGVDLVFFDELMKTVPPEYSATFVSVAQGFQFFSSVFSPLIGTFLADLIGIGPALIIAGAIRLIGFLLFALSKPSTPTPAQMVA